MYDDFETTGDGPLEFEVRLVLETAGLSRNHIFLNNQKCFIVNNVLYDITITMFIRMCVLPPILSRLSAGLRLILLK